MLKTPAVRLNTPAVNSAPANEWMASSPPGPCAASTCRPPVKAHTSVPSSTSGAVGHRTAATCRRHAHPAPAAAPHARRGHQSPSQERPGGDQPAPGDKGRDDPAAGVQGDAAVGQGSRLLGGDGRLDVPGHQPRRHHDAPRALGGRLADHAGPERGTVRTTARPMPRSR